MGPGPGVKFTGLQQRASPVFHAGSHFSVLKDVYLHLYFNSFLPFYYLPYSQGGHKLRVHAALPGWTCQRGKSPQWNTAYWFQTIHRSVARKFCWIKMFPYLKDKCHILPRNPSFPKCDYWLRCWQDQQQVVQESRVTVVGGGSGGNNDRVSSGTPKGCRFNSQLEHMLRLRVQS